MKVKYLLLSLLACAGFAVTSCTEEDPIFGGDELALKVEPSIISVGKDGGSKTIDINAGIEWKAEPKDSWITVSPSSGSGAGKVTVTVAKNDSEDARQTTVAVTAGTAKMNITVKQEAGGVVYGTAEHPILLQESMLTCPLSPTVRRPTTSISKVSSPRSTSSSAPSTVTQPST